MTTKNTWMKFWAKVEQGNDCWLWTGTKIRGYGQFVIEGRRIYAHRVAYQLAYGDIPSGMDVLHNCDNPPCVNPTHLRIGTHAENMADMRLRGRARATSGDEHHFRKHPELVRRGVSAKNARVNDEVVRNLRQRYGAGEKMISLANEFGLSIQHVNAIVKHKSWQHVI